MRKALSLSALVLAACVVAGYGAQAPAAQQANPAPQKRTHNDMMRDIATTRGRFINAVNAGNAAGVIEAGTKLESVYKEMIAYYEQMKLGPALQIAKVGAAACAEGVAAGKANNFEAAAATHRALSRSCMSCHPIYRQEAPDGLSYLPQWKPQFRSAP
jgi:hypothetical protein